MAHQAGQVVVPRRLSLNKCLFPPTDCLMSSDYSYGTVNGKNTRLSRWRLFGLGPPPRPPFHADMYRRASSCFTESRKENAIVVVLGDGGWVE
jgi:hypothetical protein